MYLWHCPYQKVHGNGDWARVHLEKDKNVRFYNKFQNLVGETMVNNTGWVARLVYSQQKRKKINILIPTLQNLSYVLLYGTWSQ